MSKSNWIYLVQIFNASVILSNIKSLSGSLNLLHCTHLQEVYADGTSLVQLRLPVGGGLRIVEYSSFNQYLTLQNYPLLTNAGVGIDLCKGVITDFFVVDCPKMQPIEVLFDIMTAQAGQGIAHALKRVRAVGFNETYSSSVVLDKLAELASGSYEGLSSDGLAGEDAIPVLDGTLNVFANAYEQSIEALRNTFKKLILNHTGKKYFRFQSTVIENTLSSMFGDGVGLTKEDMESANVFKNPSTFAGNQQITSFNEFINFVNFKDTGYGTFSNSSLTSIHIPRSITTIGRDSFYNSSLSNIVFQDGDLDLKIAISGIAFCENLKLLVLPARLISWEAYTIRESGIEKIYIKATTPPVLSKGYGDDYHKVDLFVPIGYKAIYQAATNWSLFKTITEYDFESNPHNVH